MKTCTEKGVLTRRFSCQQHQGLSIKNGTFVRDIRAAGFKKKLLQQSHAKIKSTPELVFQDCKSKYIEVILRRRNITRHLHSRQRTS